MTNMRQGTKGGTIVKRPLFWFCKLEHIGGHVSSFKTERKERYGKQRKERLAIEARRRLSTVCEPLLRTACLWQTGLHEPCAV